MKKLTNRGLVNINVNKRGESTSSSSLEDVYKKIEEKKNKELEDKKIQELREEENRKKAVEYVLETRKLYERISYNSLINSPGSSGGSKVEVDNTPQFILAANALAYNSEVLWTTDGYGESGYQNGADAYNTTVTPVLINDYLGLTQAIRIVENGGNVDDSASVFYSSSIIKAGGSFGRTEAVDISFSISLKDNGMGGAFFTCSSSLTASFITMVINLTNGTVHYVEEVSGDLNNFEYDLKPLANGWYRATVRFTRNMSGQPNVFVSYGLCDIDTLQTPITDATFGEPIFTQISGGGRGIYAAQLSVYSGREDRSYVPIIPDDPKAQNTLNDLELFNNKDIVLTQKSDDGTHFIYGTLIP